MVSTDDLKARAEELTGMWGGRDRRATIMRSVRDNDFESISPGSFSDQYPAPIVANRIDSMARDFAASLNVMPSFTCMPGRSMVQKDKLAASKRTKIVNSYIDYSHLSAQMPEIADHYATYGLAAVEIVPDFDEKRPLVRVLDGSQVYVVWDHDLETVEAAVVSWYTQFTLEAQFGEAIDRARQNFKDPKICTGDRIKMIRYQCAERTIAFLPDERGIVLADVENKLGRCTIAAVPRPSGKSDWHAEPIGQYDHLVYPLLADNELQMLTLEATAKAVEAPLVVPPDVTDIPYGPDAVIHTNNPQGVGKLQVNVPNTALQMRQIIENDIQVGGMAPGSRSGNVNASVITGRGIDALQEGYSSLIAQTQTRLAFLFKQAAEIALEMDETYWPNTEKDIWGQETDTAGQVTYTPSKDINGAYTVIVDYGALLGLDANRALIFLLQAQAAGYISTETAQRYMPIRLNIVEERNRTHIEQLQGSIIQGLAALSQAVPQMVMAGQDPSQILGNYAKIIEGLQKGKEIQDVVTDVLKPPPPPPSADPNAPADPAAAAGPGGQEAPPGLATEGPNGRPDMSQMFAGITARGTPNLSATVSRMNPVAGQ